ncbi:hypothetical protein C7441_112127 [Pseudaminobacter salicylatoxidans]|uniref:Uncharacterized protein n=1 Tax=Pseudaminobacter salicylatoxidans TaxID=93369 RepID=A0A316BZR2_PSESE|nr:hypothetical protein [Pseudaminobacter salicylatoxidans]PWJ80585.1 hypothetical protein C7441_112127 [Pseudaminobacter salicylatoxidans]
MNGDPIHEAAFAIFREFSRERDPDKARRRFETMPQQNRDQHYAEAKACLRVFEAFRMGEAA